MARQLKMMIKIASTVAFFLTWAFALPHNNENGTVNSLATSYWYANMDHTGSSRGYAPDLDPDFTYPVFKPVNSGDGNAIQNAINTAENGNRRHGQWLASQPRVGRHGSRNSAAVDTDGTRLSTYLQELMRLAKQSA